MTAVQFGRGEVKEAERAWMGINKVDQQMYLKESYLKDQLKWPPRVSTLRRGPSICVFLGCLCFESFLLSLVSQIYLP